MLRESRRAVGDSQAACPFWACSEPGETWSTVMGWRGRECLQPGMNDRVGGVTVVGTYSDSMRLARIDQRVMA